MSAIRTVGTCHGALPIGPIGASLGIAGRPSSIWETLVRRMES